MARRNPRLVITVTTTVSPVEQALVAQVEGEQGDELVAVDQLPVGVDGEMRSASPSKASPTCGPSGHDRRLQGLGVGRPAPVVDVAAVGIGVDHRHRGPQVGQHPGADGGGGPVGAVDHHPEPGEAAALEDRRLEVVGVALPGVGGAAQRPDRGPPGRRSEPGMPSASMAASAASTSAWRPSSSLRPPAANSLMPLSPKGLCEAEIMDPGQLRRRREVGHAPGWARPRGRPRRPPRRPARRRTRRPAAGRRPGCRDR